MDIREKLMELLVQNEIEFMTYSTNRVIAAAIGDDPVDRFLSRAAFTADFLLSNGVTVHEWIPASDPPKKRGRYYVHRKTESFNFVEIIQFKDGQWYYYDDEYGNRILQDVTHWMPLPQPPKGE